MWSRGLSRNQTRQQSEKFLYIRLFFMFLILFSNQRGLFSGWGVLFPHLNRQRGMEPQRLALIDVSCGCVYQTTMLSAPRAFGDLICFVLVLFLLVICGKSLCPKRPEDTEDWSTCFTSVYLWMCYLQYCCLSCVSQLRAGDVLATLPSSQGLLLSSVIQSSDGAWYSKHL